MALLLLPSLDSRLQPGGALAIQPSTASAWIAAVASAFRNKITSRGLTRFWSLIAFELAKVLQCVPEDAPKLEQDEHLSDKEKHSLEEQVAKLKRRHEDAELKNQRRIVELLEASNGQQQALDEAQRAVRAYQLNFTELSFKVQELETKRQSSELRAADAKDRADRLHQEMQEAEIE
ncbi:unnamed protein product, partial [Effrenium voratum]